MYLEDIENYYKPGVVSQQELTPNKDRYRNRKKKIRMKGKHDPIVCLQMSRLQESVVHKIII